LVLLAPGAATLLLSTSSGFGLGLRLRLFIHIVPTIISNGAIKGVSTISKTDEFIGSQGFSIETLLISFLWFLAGIKKSRLALNLQSDQTRYRSGLMVTGRCISVSAD